MKWFVKEYLNCFCQQREGREGGKASRAGRLQGSDSKANFKWSMHPGRGGLSDTLLLSIYS